MEKGYFPTSLIKFQVDTNKTDTSYLTNKNIRIGDRDYALRITDTAATPNLQRNRANVKPHPSTRFIRK